jgi:hypothetical protein
MNVHQHCCLTNYFLIASACPYILLPIIVLVLECPCLSLSLWSFIVKVCPNFVPTVTVLQCPFNEMLLFCSLFLFQLDFYCVSLSLL